VNDVAFAASPGYSYSLRFKSPDLKPDIVKAQKEIPKILESNKSQLNLLMPS
jgi:hypothetical protein